MAAKSIIRDRYTLMQADFRDTLAAVNGQADLVLSAYVVSVDVIL